MRTNAPGAPAGSSMMPTRWSMQTREAVRRRPEYAVFLPLLETADDAADELEDAAFFLSLDALQGKPREALQVLADLLVEAVAGMDQGAGPCRPDRPRRAGNAETEDFLTAIDRIAALEHQADDARALAGGDRRPARARISASCICSTASAAGSRRRRTR